MNTNDIFTNVFYIWDPQFTTLSDFALVLITFIFSSRLWNQPQFSIAFATIGHMLLAIILWPSAVG